MAKPCRGIIYDWQLIKRSDNQAVVLGKSLGHPNQGVFEDSGPIQTSRIVSLKWNKNGTVTCYTLNSRYTLKEKE